MHPVLLQTTLFGLLSKPYEIHAYGVFIAIGFLLAMVLASREAKRVGEDPDRIVDLAFYMLLTGLLGARLLFIVTRLPDYAQDPWRIIKFWQGGLVWYGGLIAAGLYVVHYTRRHRLPFFRFADILVPYMALAHAFGRLGCFAAGCCYGAPTEMPWGVVFPPGSMVHQAQQSTGLVGIDDIPMPVHPTQLYETVGELGLFVVLVLWRRHKRYDGQLLLVWLASYPLLRSLIEIYRGDVERGVYILSTSQYLSIGVALVAVALFIHLRRGHGRELPARPAALSEPWST